MAWSTDGENWTAVLGGETRYGTIINHGQSSFGSIAINAITFGNGIFVAGGNGGRMAWSIDGENWIAIPGGTGRGINPSVIGQSTFGSNTIRSIAFGNGRFVAVGGDSPFGGSDFGVVAWSGNGENWTAVSNRIFASFLVSDIAYGNGRFIAVGTQGRIVWSSNGTDWILVPNSTFEGSDWTNQILGIAFGNGMFVAVGSNGRMAWSQ